MSRFKPGILLVIAAFSVALLLQHSALVKSRNERESLRRELAQVKAENEQRSKTLSSARRTVTPRLPAPALPTNSQPSREVLPTTNLISQVLRGENAPRLTLQQVEIYLNENRRNAASLIAAARATGDQSLLQEAMEKYPHDPQVAFAAIFKPDATPEARRQWLDEFERIAPANGLANYLSAFDHFKSGQTDQAVQELSAAAGKQNFSDYSMDFMQSAEEAYRAAGYSVAEAKTLATSQLLLPQLAQLKGLNHNMVELAASYRQGGDDASSQALLQMDQALGRRLQEAPGQPLISQLVGIAIESNALREMDPAAPFGDSTQTVKDRLDELSQQRAAIKRTDQEFESFQSRISDQDWISYSDRRKAFGEQAALQWLASKYGQN
jgi:hypothetical protein